MTSEVCKSNRSVDVLPAVNDGASRRFLVITKIDGAVWKYTRYFDNPQFWSNPLGTDPCAPSAPLDILVEEQGQQPTEPGEYEVFCKRTVKDTPLPDEFEMYNVSHDPMELDNLYGRPEFRPIQNRLDTLLKAQCARKRLIPKSGVVPSQPVCRP
jgi:choline-sulfatase